METTQIPINGWMDEKLCYIYATYANIIQPHAAISNNIDGPWRNYDKWDESDKDKILNDITNLWNTEKLLMKIESKMVVTRAWVAEG